MLLKLYFYIPSTIGWGWGTMKGLPGFYPTALKGCQGIVFTYGVQAVSQKP